MQVNIPQLTGVVDGFLRYKLFKQTIDYTHDNNRKVLMLPDISQFVIKEVHRMIVEAQDTENV